MFENRKHMLEYNVHGHEAVRLFRQARGCLELTQNEDILHVCEDDVEAFVKELLKVLPKFVEATN